MNFGPQANEADSHAIMDAAREAGANFFDTANVYGWGGNECRSEEIVNLLVRRGRRARGKAVLVTKVHGNMAADAESWPDRDKLSAVNVRRAVDAALRRLRADHMDVYQCVDQISTRHGRDHPTA